MEDRNERILEKGSGGSEEGGSGVAGWLRTNQESLVGSVGGTDPRASHNANEGFLACERPAELRYNLFRGVRSDKSSMVDLWRTAR